jgi:glucans biosynthesis protein
VPRPSGAGAPSRPAEVFIPDLKQRRRLLAAAAAAAAFSTLGRTARAQASAPPPGPSAAPSIALPAAPPVGAAPAEGLRLGPAFAFDYAHWVEEARALASQPYVAPPPLAPEVLERIDYDAHGRIHFKTARALFAQGPGACPVTFFHLGRYFRTPVRLFVAAGASAREILYDPDDFDMPADSPARALPRDAGFAGFRVQESRLGPQQSLDWQTNDWAAFLGASYFRAIGELYQYGMSARGVAVDTSLGDRPEEFPAFTRYAFETPQDDATALTVCALLEGPSLCGAYRFGLRRGPAVVMEVEAALFLRRDVARLGLAPLTSMYWYSETLRSPGNDWRPEVHDSDGLALWTGAGERIWRPLNNPPQASTSVFLDEHPRGFGLMQRDRNFDHYQDGVRYERRPSVWVEPLHDWGAGAVQLIELPTDRETSDNVVAMWVPRAPARAGDRLDLRYRLHWAAAEPVAPALARCVATRLGAGGQPGQARSAGSRKFVVEFLGGPLAELPYGALAEAVVSAARGRLEAVFTEAVPDGVTGHWRAQFDLVVEGSEPVDLRLYLKWGERPLTETWLYQFQPAARSCP